MSDRGLVHVETAGQGARKAGPAPAPGFEDRLESTVARVYVFLTSMSFRYKIAAALVAVLCLAIVSLGAVSFSQQKRVLLQEMQKRAEVLVRQLGGTAKTALLTKDELGLAATVREIGKMPGVEYVVIHDDDGKVSARALSDPEAGPPPEEAGRAALKAKEMTFRQAFYGGEPVLEAAIPLITKFESRTLRVGTARVGLSQAALKEAIGRQKRVFVLVTAGFVVLGLVISFALGNVLTRQIVILVSAMKTVAQGDLDHTVAVQSHDDIGSLAEAFNEMIFKLREKLHMEKYLSATTLQLIRRFRDVDELKLGGEHRFVVILFSDVRGFTSMTEKLDADEVVGLLNLYLNLQSEVVYQHKGTVDKFVGDEIMALFTGDGAQAAAARASLEIQRYVASLNASRAGKGLREIQIGIGLNAGDVVMGNMGSERRMDYTVIGDAVNVAARLCGAAGAGQIVMSKAVRDALGAEAETKALEPLELKGKKDPFAAFTLLSVKGAQRRHFRRPARVPASFVYAGLSDERHPATVRDVGCQGCVIETGQAIGVGSMLGLTIDLPELSFLRDVPAIARHLRHLESGYLVGLAFPALAADSAARLSEWVHRVSTELPHQAHAALEP
ncbi:MAG: HAMP domain-containing protein [Elusimicrobia bacterium]|nr:HAMP domain-containing protein [Elusimicrobiota bacterium]